MYWKVIGNFFPNQIAYIKEKIIYGIFILIFFKPGANMKSEEPSPGLIIHAHGGGFISQSARSQEIFLRKWAESLDVPIFSVGKLIIFKYLYYFLSWLRHLGNILICLSRTIVALFLL